MLHNAFLIIILKMFVQIRQVEAGYTEIHMGQGTASEHLEGQVVLRRTSRKIKEVINS